MRYGKIILAAGLAMALAIPATATADSGKDHGQDKNKNQQSAMDAQQRDLQAFQPRLRQADQLIGARVRNPEGKDLGEIKDLVSDPDGQSVSYAVLSFGGFMGLGEDLYAIPWDALTVRNDVTDDEPVTVVLNIDKKQLENAEGFAEDDWPDAGDPRWARSAHASVSGDLSEGEAHAEVKTGEQKNERYGSQAAQDQKRSPSGEKIESRRLTKMMGEDVKNGAGDDIGEIQDILIDTNRGDLAYAIVDVSDAPFDIDTDMVAVPWSSLKTHGDNVTVALGENQLKQMTYDEDQRARLEDRDTAQRRHDMAKADPYWTRDAGSRRGMMGDEDSQRYGSQGHQTMQGQNMMAISGRVTSVSTDTRDGEDFLRFEVLTQDGRRLMVDGGKMSRDDRLNVSEGDQVTVTGMSQTTGRGETVVMARTIRMGDQMFEVRRDDSQDQPHHQKDQHQKKEKQQGGY